MAKLECEGKHCKYMCMDNSGKNKKFLKQSKSADWKLTYKAEFTAINSSKQNSIVEIKFATIASRGRTMYNLEKFLSQFRSRSHEALLQQLLTI